MKINQHGYIDLDFSALFVGLIIFGAVLGIGGYKVATWLWPHIKQFILWSLQ